MAAPEESLLEAIWEDGETLADDGDLGEDVEMPDAEISDGGCERRPQEACSTAAPPAARGGGEADVDVAGSGESDRGGSGGGKAKRKKRKNKRSKRGPSDMRVTDINRFVIDTCRHLREKKSYLVWNAVGCLGVSTVSDLVKEVHAIRSCGGQKTADGRRFRTGGGILWNILKTREPKAYKEIMAKGREFEKQFRQHKTRLVRKENEAAISTRSACETTGPAEQDLNDVGHTGVPSALIQSSSKGERDSVLNRIRMPIAYDDLLEEGEIV